MRRVWAAQSCAAAHPATAAAALLSEAAPRCRLLRALNGRLKKDKKFEPGTPPQQQEGRQEPPGEEREFKGFGQPRR